MFTSTLNEELSSWCLKSPFFIGTIMAYAIRRSLLLKLLFAQLVFALKTSKVLSECHHGSLLVNESLATKTPYRFVANRDDSPPIYQGCSPIKFWSMIRHGTRNPSDGIIRRMNEHLPLIREAIIKAHREGKGSLCSHELRQLSKWSPQLEGAEEKILTHEGEDELLLLGERFQKRFPNLLPEEYSNSSFKFQFTATQRAEESARSFTVGLFGRRVSKHVWFPEGIYRDPVLRFYKLCENWRKSVDKNPEASKEQRSFAKGSEMLKVQKEVTQRLGLSELLSFDDVVLIYVTCSFEMAWFPKKNSPWCAVLSDYDLKVMEYAEDLDNYWIDGYGYKINYEQACPTIKDMFNFFSSPDAKEKAIVYFSHAGAVLKMLAHLGLYRDDEPLLASNFHHMLHKRQWRVGKISSFASNIAFVLYNCGSESSVPLKILTLHQERPVRLPGCPSHEDLCSIHTFEEVFFSSIKNCDFQNICTFKSN